MIFYILYYPDAKISICTSTESESMKIFLNSFYAVKIERFPFQMVLGKDNL